MFSVGTYVVYGKRGVCEIKGIKSLYLYEKEENYYLLAPVFFNNGYETIYAPTHNPQLMRQVITKDEAQQFVEKIVEIEPIVVKENKPMNLNASYHSLTLDYDVSQYLKIVKGCYVKKKEVKNTHRKFGEIDRRYLNLVESIVCGELAFALSKPIEEIKNQIKSVVF